MTRIVSLLLVAACLLLPALDAVAQPIGRVYRADSRPPEDMFFSGFHGRGNNRDLLAHTLGEACEETDPARASAWVSTSARRETAIGFADGHLEGIPGSGPQHSMWIYTIRPDHTYFDVHGVLRAAVSAGRSGQHGYTNAHAQTLEHLLYTTVIDGENEVVAHYVAPDNILSAQQVYYDAHDNFVEGTIATNPGYRVMDSYAREEVDDLQALVPASSIRVGYGEDSDSDGSCSMSCDGAGAGIGSRNVLAAGPASAQCNVRRGSSPMLLDIIND
jgi:pertussis toxin subunit 1